MSVDDALYANDLVRCFGLREPSGEVPIFESPRDAEELRALRARLHTLFDAFEPGPTAPSVGAILTRVIVATSEGPPTTTATRDRVRHEVLELEALVALGSHRRARRAERAHLLASVLVVFGLDLALGFEQSTQPALALKATRRQLDAWLRQPR